MRTLVRIVVIGVAFLFTSQVCAEMKDADPQVKEYVAKHTPGTKGYQSWVVLTFDHKNQLWKTWKATSKCNITESCDKWNDHEPSTSEIEMQLNNVPRLHLDEKDKLMVMVVNTNPLIYSISRKATTTQDSPDLVQMQQLVGALSSFLQTFVNLRYQDWSSQSDQNVKSLEGLSSEKTKESPIVDDAINKIIDLTSKRITAFRKVVSDFERVNGELKASVGLLGSSSSNLFAATQALELGTPLPNPFNIVKPKKITNSASMDTSFLDDSVSKYKRFSEARDDVVKNKLPCSAIYSKLVQVIDVLLSFESTTLKDTEKAKLRAAIAALTQEMTASIECTPEEYVALKTIAAGLTDIADKTGSIPVKDISTPLNRKWWEILRTQAAVYVQIVEATEKSITDSGELLKKQDDVTKAAAAMDAAIIAVDEYNKSGGVIDATDQVYKPNWSKIETHKFDIVATGWRAAEFVKTRGELKDNSYEIAVPLGSGFTIGYGLLGTKAVNPTWKAVQNPLNKDQKVIARTKETSLAGDSTLLLSYHFPKWKEARLGNWKWVPGVDVGAGVGTSTRSLMIGFSFALTRWARLGVGEGFFLVDCLAKGQKEMPRDGRTFTQDDLSVVSSTDDIRTKQQVLRRTYISLVINLESLSFFKPKDSSGK